MEILLKFWDRTLDITKLKIEGKGWIKLEGGGGEGGGEWGFGKF